MYALNAHNRLKRASAIIRCWWIKASLKCTCARTDGALRSWSGWRLAEHIKIRGEIPTRYGWVLGRYCLIMKVVCGSIGIDEA